MEASDSRWYRAADRGRERGRSAADVPGPGVRLAVPHRHEPRLPADHPRHVLQAGSRRALPPATLPLQDDAGGGNSPPTLAAPVDVPPSRHHAPRLPQFFVSAAVPYGRLRRPPGDDLGPIEGVQVSARVPGKLQDRTGALLLPAPLPHIKIIFAALVGTFVSSPFLT